MIGEDDLALVNALQVQPRADWTELASVLECAPGTAARRWQRLRETGTAWVTAVPGARCAAFVAYVGLRCAAGRREDVSASLLHDPAAVTVELTAGSYDLLVEVVAPDLAAFSRYLLDRVEKLPGVTAVTVAIATAVLTEASRWRLDALDAGQSSALHAGAGAGTAGAGRRPARGLSPLDTALLGELGRDGRRSWEQLARATGTSAATARRRTERLLGTGEAALRCDVAAPLVERSVTASLWVDAPVAELGAVARSLTGVPSVRFVATIAGAQNLLVTVWLRTTNDVHALEAELVARHPSLRVTDRTVALRTAKRMGRLLDDSGRSIDTVGLGPWAYGD